MEFLHLENDYIHLSLLKDFAFKITSIVHKKSKEELLFQPRSHYRLPQSRALFEDYDTSGLDDCIPTIDSCFIEGLGNFQDHGDVWSKPWEIRSLNGAFEGRVSLENLPLLFSRKVSLNENKILLDYSLENLSDQAYPWLWALHGLFRYQEDAILEFPGDFSIQNVQNDEVWNFDIRKMEEVPQKSSYKFYFNQARKEGRARILYPSLGLSLSYAYDPSFLPYLGCWITTGGFKGEKNIAIEPTNGFYDSLKRAISLKKHATIFGKEKHTWSIQLEIKEL